jgi:hypothetical protein
MERRQRIETNQSKGKKVKLPVLKFILVFAPLIASCATSRPAFVQQPNNLLISESDSFSPPSEISKQGAHEDIDLLIYSLQVAYGGRSFVSKDEIQNTLKSLTNLSNHIKGSIKTTDFCSDIAKALSSTRDAHLGAFFITPGGFHPCILNSIGIQKGQVGKNIAGPPFNGPRPKIRESLRSHPARNSQHLLLIPNQPCHPPCGEGSGWVKTGLNSLDSGEF